MQINVQNGTNGMNKPSWRGNAEHWTCDLCGEYHKGYWTYCPTKGCDGKRPT